jgi:CheY-like chemotaxis protein
LGGTARGRNADAQALGRAVLCVSGAEVRAAARSLLERTGLVVVADVDRGLDALAATVHHEADLVVLDLTLVGTLGLRVIELMRSAAPTAEIVAISPLDTLGRPALDAGAGAVLTPDELHRLPGLLGEFGLSA